MAPSSREPARLRCLRVATILAWITGITSGCALHRPVTRVVDGRVVEGRHVSEHAYSTYVQAVEFEAAGALEQAARAYEAATRHDPQGVELWTRLGAVLCRRGLNGAGAAAAGAAGAATAIAVGAGAVAAKADDTAQDAAAAWRAFDRAHAIDPTYEPLWTERSTCFLHRGAPQAAVDAARRAVSLDPDAIEPVIALATALHRMGQTEEAQRWLDGLVARTPTVESFRAMLEFSTQTRDAARIRIASDGLEQLGHLPVVACGAPSTATASLGLASPHGSSPAPGAAAPQGTASASASLRVAGTGCDSLLTRLDEALLVSDYRKAERLALSMHLAPASLALRAVALGRATWAKERADLLLRTDPSNSDARVALAVAGDFLRDEGAIAMAFATVPSHLEPLSPLGALLLDRLLHWRIGTSMDATPEFQRIANDASDPLIERLLKRQRRSE